MRAASISPSTSTRTASALHETAERTGIPYQRLLNNILKEGFASQRLTEDRLARFEKELARLKKKLVA